MRRRELLCVLIIVAVASLSACVGLFSTSAELVGYRVGPGSNEITVVYLTGPGDGAGAAEVLAQDSDQVKLRVKFHRARGPQNAVAEKHEVVVTLEAPLGGRKVLNEAGAEIEKCGPGVGCTNP